MKLKDIVYVALFSSIICALGIIPAILTPIIPVPIHAQSLGPMLAGSILGSKRGGLSCLIFLLLAIIGLPVLAGGRGGLGVFYGPTAGFLIAYPISAYLIGFLYEISWSRINSVLAFFYIAVGGIIVMYVPGVLWLSFITATPFLKSLYGLAIFLPGDIIKVLIATTISMVVRRSYPIIGRVT